MHTFLYLLNNKISRVMATLCMLFLCFSLPCMASNNTESEIEYLIAAISNSKGTFIRNGKEYSAEDAGSHLNMKYRRASKYATTAEEFIDNLASRSSMTRKPYFIRLDNKKQVEAGPWLHEQLILYRQKSQR